MKKKVFFVFFPLLSKNVNNTNFSENREGAAERCYRSVEFLNGKNLVGSEKVE